MESRREKTLHLRQGSTKVEKNEVNELAVNEQKVQDRNW